MEPESEYQRVTKMIEETRAKCQATLASCSSTIQNLNSSLKTLSETRSNIDNFYSEFDQAMKNLCNGISSAFGASACVYKAGNHSKDYMPSKESTVQECFEVLKDKKRIVFLTGAGISIASGIPCYRGIGAADLFSKDGVTYQNEEIQTVAFMQAHPEIFWERNLQFVTSMKGKKYNVSHAKIQELMNVLAPSMTLVTQNIDGLHGQALNVIGNEKAKAARNHFYEVHGSKDTLRCNNRSCDQFEIPFNMPENIGDFRELVCKKCKQLARPNILYFDESYSEKNQRTESLKEELESMDALITVGTMLETGFASMMVANAIRKNIPVIEVNLTPACEVGAYILKDKAEVVIPQLCDALIKYKQGGVQQIQQGIKRLSVGSVKPVGVVPVVVNKPSNSIVGRNSSQNQTMNKVRSSTSLKQPVVASNNNNKNMNAPVQAPKKNNIPIASQQVKKTLASSVKK